MIRRIFNKVHNLIKYGYVSLPGNDFSINGKPVTKAHAQIISLGSPRAIAVISPYGLNANLPLKTKVLIWNILGQEDNPVCIGFSQEDRFKDLKPGEVVVGNPKSRAFIKFDKDGNIEINAPGELNIKATKVNIDADETNLGVGGAKIARLGDEVTVNSDIGTITGSGDNTSI